MVSVQPFNLDFDPWFSGNVYREIAAAMWFILAAEMWFILFLEFLESVSSDYIYFEGISSSRFRENKF